MGPCLALPLALHSLRRPGSVDFFHKLCIGSHGPTRHQATLIMSQGHRPAFTPPHQTTPRESAFNFTHTTINVSHLIQFTMLQQNHATHCQPCPFTLRTPAHPPAGTKQSTPLKTYLLPLPSNDNALQTTLQGHPRYAHVFFSRRFVEAGDGLRWRGGLGDALNWFIGACGARG